jgi:hypothetical protein
VPGGKKKKKKGKKEKYILTLFRRRMVYRARPAAIMLCHRVFGFAATRKRRQAEKMLDRA